MPDNKKIGELPGEVTLDGAKWCRTSTISKQGMYSWAKGATSAEVDQLFKAGSPPHYTVSSRKSGWVSDVHFSDGGSRIYYFQPKTPHSAASVGWGEHVPQSSPYRKQLSTLRAGLKALLTQFGIEHAGLLEAVDVAPVAVVVQKPLNLLDDFPPLGAAPSRSGKK